MSRETLSVSMYGSTEAYFAPQSAEDGVAGRAGVHATVPAGAFAEAAAAPRDGHRCAQEPE
jgi:hypothetical protein